MARRAIDIDRDKLRAALGKLRREYVVALLEDAIDLLPRAKRHEVLGKYLDLKRLGSGSEKVPQARLLEEVKAFERASLSRKYYESFNVNSKNFMEQSEGTTRWIAECRRLLNRCVGVAKNANPAEVRQAFDIIFGLLDRINECRDDIIFFADEPGAWQVGVEWEEVLPPWFTVLSVTAEPEEFAQKILGLLKHHCRHASAELLTAARKAATRAQRQALSTLAAAAAAARSSR